MRSRRALFFLSSVVCAATLAACGGGGGTPGPVPTPVPTNASYRPAAAGDTFSYAGSIVQTFVRPPITIDPIPSPNPPSTQTLAETVQQSVSVLPGPTSGLFPGATYDVRTAETDVLLSGLETQTQTTDAYETYVPRGASTIVSSLGSSATTSGGSTFIVLLGTGNGLLDVLPEVTGTLPSNNAAEIATELDATSQSSTRTTNADGTYSEAIAYPDGTRTSGTANADGSATLSLPLVYPVNTSFVVGAPQPDPSGTPFVPITITYPAGLFVTPNATPTPTIVHRTVAVWYPTPLSLAQDSLVDAGSAPVPAACNVPPALARPARELVETQTSVDPIFGETDARTTATYVEPGIGVACVQSNDVVTQYYDFSRQTQYLILTQSTPEQTTTTSETLGITQATVLGLNSTHRRLLENREVVAANLASFDAFLARARTIRHDVARVRVLGAR